MQYISAISFKLVLTLKIVFADPENALTKVSTNFEHIILSI